MPEPDSFRSTPTRFDRGRVIDTGQLITKVSYCYASAESVTCTVTLEDGVEVVAFSYLQFSLHFGDELLGMSLFEAQQLFRERDIAYIGTLLGSLHD